MAAQITSQGIDQRDRRIFKFIFMINSNENMRAKGVSQPQRRDERGRFMPKSKSTVSDGTRTQNRQPFGLYIQITGGDDNLYLLSLFKSFCDLIEEEKNCNLNSELRFAKKYEGARTLFPEYRKGLSNCVVRSSFSTNNLISYSHE